MGDAFEDWFDRQTEAMCEPLNWRHVGRHPAHYDRYGLSIAFRDQVHATVDGRQYRIHEMDTMHLVNCVNLIERKYRERNGLNFWDQRAMGQMRQGLFKSNPYHAMTLELTYRRYILQEPFDCELLEPAVSAILSVANNPEWAAKASRGYDTKFKYGPKTSKPKETNMSTNQNMISLLQKDFYTVGVKFENSQQEYTYKVPNKVKLEKNDWVVTARANTFGVAKVTRVDEVPQINANAQYEYTWIVQKVEAAAYKEQIRIEGELKKELLQVENAHQREVLIEKMSKHLPEESEAGKMFKGIREKASQLVIGTDFQEAKEEKAAS